MISLVERRPLTVFSALSAASVAAYLLVFGFILQRPLTLGDMMAMIERKQAIASATGPGKVIIAAGSNGRYSHSCEVISRELGRPCVNMSVAATVGPELLLQTVLDQVGPGDLIYLPLEYPTLANRAARTDASAPWLWRNDRPALWRMGLTKTLEAAFAFDVRFGIEAMAEMALSAAGIQRRAGLETLNAFGDETSNTPEAARAYATFIAEAPYIAPVRPASEGTLAEPLQAFVRDAEAKGAKVVGGLPTIFADRPIDPTVVASVETYYRLAGADFVRVDGDALYARQAFFDTPDHLQTPAQQEHSRRVARALRPLSAFSEPRPKGRRAEP